MEKGSHLRQEGSHQILSLLSPITWSPFSDHLSLQTDQTWVSDYQRALKQKEQWMWVLCLGFYHFWQEWSNWVPRKRRWSLRIRIVISHPPCSAAFFLASFERMEISHSFLVSSSTDLLHPASSDLGAVSALYDKGSNKRLDEKG